MCSAPLCSQEGSYYSSQCGVVVRTGLGSGKCRFQSPSCHTRLLDGLCHLHTLSLICLAVMWRKWQGEQVRWLPYVPSGEKGRVEMNKEPGTTACSLRCAAVDNECQWNRTAAQQLAEEDGLKPVQRKPNGGNMSPQVSQTWNESCCYIITVQQF